jgi:carboxyl-terminal processing protease
MNMTRTWMRWTLTAALSFGTALTGGVVALAEPLQPQATASQVERGSGFSQIATIDELKTEAFKALKGGRFDRVNELLTRAASMGDDPVLKQMAVWTNQFEAQRREFAAERRKAYEKTVAEVELLLKNNKESYAIDLASRAYLLADDKKAFRVEPWVDSLVRQTIKLADEAESEERWLVAMRIYSDLGAIEPSNPQWKDKLKVVTRRVRLLAIYTPDILKQLQEKEGKDREEVDALLKPEKSPTTKPAEKLDNDAFRIDWRETLKDIRMGMLRDALEHAAENYYRDVSYRKMTTGGINALRVVVTTKGLEAVFPKLADANRVSAFLKTLDEQLDRIANAPADNQQLETNKILTRLQIANRDTLQLPEEVLVSEFADGAFAELDQFTSMIWPSDVAEFNKTTQGEFSGVGIQIQSGDDGSLKVVSPIEDSPAYKAGIKAGDVIAAINGKSAKGITTNQAVKTITGPPGTFVTLLIRSPDGTEKALTLKRETIKVASVKGWLHLPGGGWDYFIDPEQKIGYLRMTNFTRTTSDELDKAVDELRAKGARGVILDLRYNPGGLLTAATDVSDKFLQDGLIVSTRADRATPNQPTSAVAHADGGETDIPLAVLINQYSASASEIVSGALKDQKRAIIVGERTFGKGSVQMLFPLSSRQAYLKLTTSHYYLPSGKCIHREENSTDWGVDPDVTVEMTPEQMRAAIDARQEMDILRDKVIDKIEEGKLDAKVVEQQEDKTTTNPSTTQPAKKGLLESDPQLSAALLMLRLKLSGATL